MVFGKPVELPYEHVAVTIDPQLYTQYIGEYEGVKIHQKGDKLLYSDYDIELIPESETKFFRADNDDRTLEFIQNEQGKTVQLILSKMGVPEVKHKDP